MINILRRCYEQTFRCSRIRSRGLDPIRATGTTDGESLWDVLESGDRQTNRGAGPCRSTEEFLDDGGGNRRRVGGSRLLREDGQHSAWQRRHLTSEGARGGEIQTA